MSDWKFLETRRVTKPTPGIHLMYCSDASYGFNGMFRFNLDTVQLNADMKIYCKSMGKLFRVTAICRTDDEANRIMQRDNTQGVIACTKDGISILANRYETKVPSGAIPDDL
jgi:hypothetical protein